ncbi:lipid A-modifier LpxR family protein [Neolewinella agarilytica]|uniref:Lipid A deacylase LpxR family protein n=1 Tax=Neolewinella agarilytica TaxID=478744 RepID=A0A1H9LL40_9BACT|nr:lipid A-modifier LpxR family protein [Neolewinella agarilytica]SER11613.1 hypothetical protein SAMN05444359_12466 [Neolewinella agarilytica]
MNCLRAICGAGLFLVVFSLTGQVLPGDHYLATDIANDVFYLPKKTDRYFSSGLAVEYGDRSLVKAAVGSNGLATLRQYWRLQQNIYTPEDIQSTSLVAGDRPFASYLVLSRGKDFFDESLGFRLEREWTAGVLGKYSFGGQMQNAFHDMVEFAERIPGWKYEVKPDAIINYRLRLTRRLSYGRRLQLNPRAETRLGSLHTDVSAGLMANLTVIDLSADRQLGIALSGDARLVGYDATLSGGLLNRDDRYRGVVIPRRLVGSGSLDVFLDYEGWQLRGGITTQSTDFEGGQPHVWAWFGLRTGGRK